MGGTLAVRPDAPARRRHGTGGRLLPFTALAAFLLAAVQCRNAAGAEPGADAAAMLGEMRALVGTGSREPGAPANLALEEQVARRFAESGFTNGSIHFGTPVFIPGKTVLTVPGMTPVTLLAMHPTLLHPGNLDLPEFETSVVYLGKGTQADLQRLKGTQIDGALGLMDYDCGDSWRDLLRFGIKAFVFIGAPDYDHGDSKAKIYNTEVGVPRFFVDAAAGEKLKAACLEARSVRVGVRSDPSRWDRANLRDLWVLVPGTNTELKNEVVLFTARMDANSIVPELATGAQSAMNLYLLLKMLEDFKANPPGRAVMLAAVNAHTQSYLGERILAWHLLADSLELDKLRSAVACEMRVARLFNESYSKLQLGPVDMDAGSLHAAMELLWALDAKQQEQRKAEREAALAKLKATAAGSGTNSPAPPPAPLDPVLDLSPFGEQDYRNAVEAAIRTAREREKGVALSRQVRNDEMRAAFESERQQVESLAQKSFDELKALAARAKSVFDDEKLFESWRTKLDGSTGLRLPIKKELQTAAMRRQNSLLRERLVLVKNQTMAAEEKARRMAELTREKADATRVLVLFNKIDFGIGRRRVLYRNIATNEVQRTLLKGFRDELAASFARSQRLHRERLDADSANDSIREALGGRRVALAVSLELTGNSGRTGFCSKNPFFGGSWQREFGKFVAKIAAEVPATAADGRHPFVDALSGVDGADEDFFFSSTDSAIQFFLAAKSSPQAKNTPALALKNAFAGAGRTFSPDDTFEHLDVERVNALQAWLRSFFPRVLNDPATSAQANLDPDKTGFVQERALWSLLVRTVAFDEMTGEVVPSKVVPDTLVALYASKRSRSWLLDGDVANCVAGFTDSTGQMVAYGLMDLEFAPTAYSMDAGFHKVLHAMDKGRIQTSMQMNSNTGREASKTLPMFLCDEFTVYDRLDPTLIPVTPITIEQVWPKSGVTAAEPQRFGVHGVATPGTVAAHEAAGPIGIYLAKKHAGQVPETLMLITGQKRCALNSSAETPQGSGYASNSDLGPDFFARVARDMDFLNNKRWSKMKGVANTLVAEFLRAGRQALEEMDAARAANDHVAMRIACYRALGSEVKAYTQLAAMNADMLKAVIVYMGLMVPFCYCLQKLLLGLDKLEHEILAFSGFFVLMYALFRFIHPAFAIAKTPEAIFIAFVLGAIGCFVTIVMHSRFQAEMRLIFSKGMSLGEDAGYNTIGNTAMQIGLRNMRRRRVRTTLTTATIVLVVFTMLAFSSVSQFLEPTLVTRSSDAPYTGFFYHRPAGEAMDEETATALKNLFSSSAEVTVRRTLSTGLGWPLERTAAQAGATISNSVLRIKGLVGLPPNDRIFLAALPMQRGRFFSSADAREIILPSMAAEAMRISPEDVGRLKLRFRGEELTLVGLADDQRLRLVRDLNPDLPLIPFEVSTGPMGARQAGAVETGEEIGGTLTVDTSALVLLPEKFAAAMGARAQSLSVRFPEDASGRATVELHEQLHLLNTVAEARFFVGSSEPFKASANARRVLKAGVYYIGSSYRTSIGGLSRLIIPLLIAGLIILNSMLGTAYERRHEIAVYNAIGLNPTHIFMFFLAEAFVYGFIGSVGGYLIGQILSLALQHSDLIRDINVNFSSLMVVYTILFTIGLTLLSTIYPAHVATKMAVPSGKKHWSLPPVENHVMQVVFPFIYDAGLTAGVMYYVYEDFLFCTDKSLNNVIASLDGKSAGADAEGRPIYSLSYSVGLAPFDLGVTQKVLLRTQYDPAVSSYRLYMSITHVAGLDSNWVGLNRFFLERMRRFLMRWRNMDSSLFERYSVQGRALFHDGPAPQAGAASAQDGKEATCPS